MNIIKKLILLICPIMIGQSTFAQGDPFENLPTTTNVASYASTPQTWAFIRYGSTPVDYYTGKAMISVPIYTYSDNDFEIPISAGYASEGFIPNRPTGILGLNWYLNCGGSISREIRGIPDDFVDEEVNMSGFLRGSATSDDSIFKLEVGGLNSTLTAYQVNDCETTSDIYHFNFLGHSGTFHFNGDKDVVIYNTNGLHGTYSIETYLNNNLQGFKVTTADGYQYIFGNEYDSAYEDSVERSIKGSFATVANLNINDYRPIVTWNLTKIIAPNGRVVEFEYTDVSSATIYPSINPKTTNNPFLVMSFTTGDSIDMYGVNHYRNISITRTCYLEKIIIDDDNTCEGSDGEKIVIEFEKSLKGCLDRPESDRTSDICYDHNVTQELYKLDAVRVKTFDGEQIHNTSFIYKITNNRLILTTISTDGLGDYKISYYEDYPYPAISTADIDFWGFYNGRGNSYTTIHGSSVDDNLEDIITSEAKLPDWRYSRLGCIKRITYPTKGFTEFEYEANTADCILLRREKYSYIADSETPVSDSEIEDACEPKWYLVCQFSYKKFFENTDETGGVRIKRITDYDGLGGFQSREFLYDKGTVYSFPKYYGGKIGLYQTYFPLLDYPINSLDKQHIGYAKVKEMFADESYVVHHYNSYETHPDEYDDQQKKKIESAEIIDILNHKWVNFINNILREPNSNNNKRGKLNCQEFFNANGELVRKTSYEYAMHNDNHSAYVVLSGRYAYSVKQYIGDYRLVGIKDIMYYGDNSISTIKTISYDSLGRNDLTITTYADGSQSFSGTQYQADEGRHQLDCPKHQFEAYSESNNNIILRNAVYYDYHKTADSLLLPKSIKRAIIPDYYMLNTDLSNLDYRSIGDIVSYNSYNRPIEVVDEHGVHTAILWGYNGMYPVATVKNMTWYELKSLLRLKSNNPLTGALEDTQRNTLYSETGVLVDVYEYEPLIGITKHYDNNGKMTSYSYDSFGRLTSTSDEMGGIQLYRYNLSGGDFPSLDMGDITPNKPSSSIIPNNN